MHPISVLLSETVYPELARREGIEFPLLPRHIAALDSVVKTVEATYWSFERYPSPEDKAAAYFTFIIKDHPVADGNKRLSVYFLEIYCLEKGLTLNMAPSVTLDALAVSVEKGGESHLLVQSVRRILFHAGE